MIKKETEIPQKEPRGKFRKEIRDLKPGEALVISGEHLTDKTLRQIYTAASRERKSILTKQGVTGLRVWLNPEIYGTEPEPEETIEAEVPMTKDEKLENLRNLLGGHFGATRPKRIRGKGTDRVRRWHLGRLRPEGREFMSIRDTVDKIRALRLDDVLYTSDAGLAGVYRYAFEPEELSALCDRLEALEAAARDEGDKDGDS